MPQMWCFCSCSSDIRPRRLSLHLGHNRHLVRDVAVDLDALRLNADDQAVPCLARPSVEVRALAPPTGNRIDSKMLTQSEFSGRPRPPIAVYRPLSSTIAANRPILLLIR